MKRTLIVATTASAAALAWAVFAFAAPPAKHTAASSAKNAAAGFDSEVTRYARTMLEEGRNTFRYDTFGSEALLGRQLELHKAIAGEKNGGVGPGVSPKTALAVGSRLIPMPFQLP